MNKNRFKRIMAYVYMPLFFLLLGYSIVYIVLNPYIQIASNIAGLVVSNTDVSFNQELTSAFNPEALDEEMIEADIVDMAIVDMPRYQSQFAQFSCDAVDLSVPLYYGDTELVLRYGAGMYTGSTLPGFGGTVLVAGHNHTVFKPFEDLELGDVITIQTNYGLYEYQVVNMEVLHKDDDNAFSLWQTEKEVLVAYTCYPFTAITALTDDRLFVTAEKISGPEVVQS